MNPILAEHLTYLTDTVRLERFRTALAQVVRPGDVVADLGCGSGVLGLLCLQAGAAHIYAIDSSGAIEVARETFHRAGLTSQVDFIADRTFRINLPQKVDLIICDHVGFFGFDYGLVELLADARRRFLKPAGRIVPGHLRIRLAGVEARACRDITETVRSATVPPEYHWLKSELVNDVHAVTLKPQDIAAGPSPLAEIDLGTDQPAFFRWHCSMTATRNATLHGLAGWFDCELSPGVSMTNSPVAESPIQRSQAFLPFDEPLEVLAGDTIAADIMVRPSDRVIAWNVRNDRSGRSISHSTWHAQLGVNLDRVKALAPAHVPSLNRDGQARRTVLGYVDGVRTRQQISAQIAADHPQLFPTQQEIHRFVDEILNANCIE